MSIRPTAEPAAAGNAGRRRTPAARAGGFTLLEVVVALTLLTLVAALALPALLRPSGTEVRAAAGSVASGLRRARETAVNENQSATLTVNVQRGEYQVSGEPRPRRVSERVALSLYTARSELIDEHAGRIRFFPDGSSTGGRVTLKSGERAYFVDVDWLTGRVRVRGGDADDEDEVESGRLVLRR